MVENSSASASAAYYYPKIECTRNPWAGDHPHVEGVEYDVNAS
jgi:hypothetical protein